MSNVTKLGKWVLWPDAQRGCVLYCTERAYKNETAHGMQPGWKYDGSDGEDGEAWFAEENAPEEVREAVRTMLRETFGGPQ